MTLRCVMTFGCALASVAPAVQAVAQDRLILTGPDTESVAPDSPRWVACFTLDQAADKKYVGSIIETTAADTEQNPTIRWRTYLKEEIGLSSELVGGCNVEKSAAEAQARRQIFMKQDPYFPHPIVEVSWTMPPAKSAQKSAGLDSDRKNDADAAGASALEADPVTPPRKSAAQIAAEEAAARKAQREAEFQAKQDEYERQLAERERKVREFNELKAKMEAQKEANRVAAEKALAEYQGKMSEHSQTVAEHDAEVARYEQEVAAAKIVRDFDERNGLEANGEASTDDDANRCISSPELQQNAAFQGNTAASIVNGCGKPVDVRICLMTEAKGWNCGVQYGVAPQAKWSYSSFHATGQLFVDARVSGVNRPLASPQ